MTDGRNRIAECNDAARQLAGGQPLVGRFLADLPALSGLAGDLDEREAVIGDPPRTFDIGGAPLTYSGTPGGCWY